MTTSSAVRRRDRWAEWAVIALVALALVAGLAVRETVLSRTIPFSFPQAGISGRCPADWVRETGDDPLLRARDPLGGAYGPVLELRSRLLAAEGDPALVLDTLALERAGQGTAYETLRTERVAVEGKDAIQRTFAYVHVDSNPYLTRLPVVVQGRDLALRDGDRLVVVTLLADAEHFDDHLRYLRTFVESLQL